MDQQAGFTAIAVARWFKNAARVGLKRQELCCGWTRKITLTGSVGWQVYVPAFCEFRGFTRQTVTVARQKDGWSAAHLF
jgi:hypothetical protein